MHTIYRTPPNTLPTLAPPLKYEYAYTLTGYKVIVSCTCGERWVAHVQDKKNPDKIQFIFVWPIEHLHTCKYVYIAINVYHPCEVSVTIK